MADKVDNQSGYVPLASEKSSLTTPLLPKKDNNSSQSSYAPPKDQVDIPGAAAISSQPVGVSSVFVSDVRKLNSVNLARANEYFKRSLEGKFGSIQDKSEAFEVALPAILYFCRIHTTSGEAKHEQTSVNFLIGNQNVNIVERDLVETARNCPQLRTYSNPLRAWCRSNEKRYIEYSRQNPDLPCSSRATKIGLPSHFSWLEADFLTGEYLTDEERAALMVATKVALSKSAVAPEARIISLTQLGKTIG
ncbi:coat protein [Fig virus B]|uniref:PCP n=1 Tax=Fig closterovirus 1 TaxID=2809010 RepID=A0A8A0Y3K3_9CLOS|nr:coat protein [Fig virus B]QSQ86316.1 pCP [Fig closterovirus 1]